MKGHWTQKYVFFFFLIIPSCLIKIFPCPCKHFFFHHYSCTTLQKRYCHFSLITYCRMCCADRKNKMPGVYMSQCMPQMGEKGKNESYELLDLYWSGWLWFITSQNQHCCYGTTVVPTQCLYGIGDAWGRHRYEWLPLYIVCVPCGTVGQTRWVQGQKKYQKSEEVWENNERCSKEKWRMK